LYAGGFGIGVGFGFGFGVVVDWFGADEYPAGDGFGADDHSWWWWWWCAAAVGVGEAAAFVGA
jgi:hypothetical protein